ncbi:major allergen I polypeptide chain 2-like isoform X1 [Dasypus novemcinctus]|uniref:major allergen I polypeptide chain 2-like isoform X1 n=1 Tax=Dasypus novemcinctus TaxID=9361 RepID=UPI000C843B8F|nr:major allergen I polypeptide chain 2-like isoform X1 [Dasypus novemcinctus]
MKGTLLVLALLVTRELSIQTAEACPLFYEVFGLVALGNKDWLNTALESINATEAEMSALDKIQECYNEAGLAAKGLDLIVMGTISLSKECILS